MTHLPTAPPNVDLVLDSALSELTLLSEQINGAVRDAESHARAAVTDAMLAGALLTQAKALVAHGHWEAWLQTNCFVAPRTAQAYMRLHHKVPTLPPEEAQRVALLPLREAIKAISTDPTQPVRRNPNVRSPAQLPVPDDGVAVVALPPREPVAAEPKKIIAKPRRSGFVPTKSTKAVSELAKSMRNGAEAVRLVASQLVQFRSAEFNKINLARKKLLAAICALDELLPPEEEDAVEGTGV